MNILIKSRFSEIGEMDGLYSINIPDDLKGWMNIIENAGHFLDAFSDYGLENKEDFLEDYPKYKDYDFVKAEKFINNDGSNLRRTLNYLGWDYDELDCYDYDADYCEFN